MRKLLLTILGIGMIWGGNALMAQNKIEQDIKAAAVHFDEGNVSSSLAVLKKIENEDGITDAQKIQLYRQMTICYIFLNQEDSTDMATNIKLAKQSYLKLLNENNIYEPDSNDIIDYIRFTEKFSSKPLFLITPYMGFNSSIVDVLAYYGTSNISDSAYYVLNSSTPYKPVFTNITVGLNGNWNFNQAFSVELGAAFTQRSYKYKENLRYGKDFTLEFTEKQQWIDIAALLKFDFGESKIFIPYVYAGGTYNLMLNSRFDLVKRSFSELPTEIDDVMPARYQHNMSIIAGGGLKWRVFGKHYLTIDGQYGRMMGKINNIDERFTSPLANKLTYGLGYIDNDIRLNNVRFAVGFTYAIYNPKMNE